MNGWASARYVSPQQRSTAATAEGVCPIVDAVEQVGSKWRLVVLYELDGRELRFNELKRETGASSRTLSRVLDDLQETDLVARRVEADGAPATFYSLTEKGAALEPVFGAVEDWAREWLAACEG